jgi:hypothetical protein
MSVKFKIGDTIVWKDTANDGTSVFKIRGITNRRLGNLGDITPRYEVLRLHNGEYTSIAVEFADVYYDRVVNGVELMMELS